MSLKQLNTPFFQFHLFIRSTDISGIANYVNCNAGSEIFGMSKVNFVLDWLVACSEVTVFESRVEEHNTP